MERLTPMTHADSAARPDSDPDPARLGCALVDALRGLGLSAAGERLEPLADTGLAHWHLRIPGTGWLARVPKQSQLGLAPAAHLAYEAACFERAQAGGHAPRLHAALPPSASLPHGALLVDEIVGRPARLPHDLTRLVDALAALHALPLPAGPDRAPLLCPADPLQALRDEIELQAAHLDQAGLAPAARVRIEHERAALARRCAGAARPRTALVAFDGHPGNFVVDAHGRAWLVDLEKARYGHPAVDLAHATLYTSTTWDRASHAALSVAEVAAACERWCERVAADAAERAWIVPLRRAMWLWSVTWCAKWRVMSGRPPAAATAGGEDWSAALSEAALVAHVRDRVDHYLSRDVVDRVCDEAEALDAALAASASSASNRPANTASRRTA